MPLGRDDVPERSRGCCDPTASTAQRWMRLDREPDGCDVPLRVHVRCRAEPVLRCCVPSVPQPRYVRDGVWVLVVAKPVPRLQPAVRQHQLRPIDVSSDLRRKHVRLELQAEQVPVGVAEQCVCVAAAGECFDVPGSLLVHGRAWILLQLSMCDRDD